MHFQTVYAIRHLFQKFRTVGPFKLGVPIFWDHPVHQSFKKKKNRKTRPMSKHATESRRRIASTVGLVSAREHPADGADTS